MVQKCGYLLFAGGRSVIRDFIRLEININGRSLATMEFGYALSQYFTSEY